MHLWKAWHDSRDRVVLYSLACLAIGLAGGMDAITWSRWHRYWVILRPEWLRHERDFPLGLWMGILNWLQDFMQYAMVWAGMTLGATSVGREYGSGAMAFVLTRPCPRRRLAWMEWSIGLTEILVMLSVFVVAPIPFLTYASKTFHWFGAVPLLITTVMAAVLYGLTYFATMVTGSSMKGLSLSTAVVLFYVLFPTALDEWWHIQGPLKMQQSSFRVFEWVHWGATAEEPLRIGPHWGLIALWAAVALLFPFLSQLWLERKEV